MTLSDRIAHHVKQKRTMALRGSPIPTGDENDENYLESNEVQDKINFGATLHSSPGSVSKQGKIRTAWKTQSGTKIRESSGDNAGRVLLPARKSDGNHRLQPLFPQSPLKNNSNSPFNSSPQKRISNSALSDAMITPRRTKSQLMTDSTSSETKQHKIIVSAQSLLTNFTLEKQNGSSESKPAVLLETPAKSGSMKLEEETAPPQTITGESTRDRVLRRLSNKKQAMRCASAEKQHLYSLENERELCTATSLIYHKPNTATNNSPDIAKKMDDTVANLLKTNVHRSQVSARLWAVVAKKIDMNATATELTIKESTTPVKTVKGSKKSFESEVVVNQPNPSMRVPNCGNSSNTDSSDKADTRANLDKRTARLRFSQAFMENLSDHACRNEVETSDINQNEGSELRKDYSVESIYESQKVLHSGKVAIFVRKRPIFQYEKARKDFDVISMSSLKTGDKVTIHNCFMHPDMQQLKIKSSTYPCTMAFDESSSNDHIYQIVADPLVRDVSVNRGVATILMYGQTGSGKSFTMSAIEKGMCEKIFYFLSSEKKTPSSDGAPVVTIRFVELAGKFCRDLLTTVCKDATVKIVDNDDGTVQILNATQKVCKSSEELLDMIEKGKSRRATEATAINAVSSRSHAVCQVEIFSSIDWKRKDFSNRGILSLIDCAGSERRNDSLYHDSSRQKETSEINASLYALKECIRARAKSSSKNPYVPYRASNLTRLLRESLENEEAKLCVIATIAPNATDTEHTMETLKTVSSLAGNEAFISNDEPRVFCPGQKKKKPLVSPKEMNHMQLVSWLRSQKISADSIPENIDGKGIMRMTAKQISVQCFYEEDAALDVFKKLRNESDRVGKIQLEQRKTQKLMKKA